VFLFHLDFALIFDIKTQDCMKDYYKTLGVGKNATKDEIKKAFYKLAHEHHPDKNKGDDKKFKEVNEAYQVLSDEKKRAHYDQFGTNPGAAGSSTGGFNPNDFSGFDFSQFGFGGAGNNGFHFEFNGQDMGDMFGDMFGFSAGKKRKQRGEDLQILVGVTYTEMFLGATKKINYNRHIQCEKCKGEGGEPGTKKHDCPKCAGRGTITQLKRTIFGQIQSQTVCPDCIGVGQVFDKKCSDCKGEGIKLKKEEVQVPIPENVEDGQQLLMRGYGECAPHGGGVGDLYVVVRLQKNKPLTKKAKELLEQLKNEGY
jgi:molecular chaperone DnaJ